MVRDANSLFFEIQTAEVEIAHEGRLAETSFDGYRLSIDGQTLYEFEGREEQLARIVLYRTLSTPDTEVYKSQIRLPMRATLQPENLERACNVISDLYQPVTGWRPLKTVMETASASVPIVRYVIFQSRQERAEDETANVQAVKHEPTPTDKSIAEHNLSVQQHENERWISYIRQYTTVYKDVPFELMHPDIVTVFSIMNKSAGRELSMIALQSLFEEASGKQLKNEEFIQLMQRVVHLYRHIQTLSQRIHFSTRPINGVMQGFFTWRNR